MAYLSEFKQKYGNPVDEEQAIQNVWLNGMRKAGEKTAAPIQRPPISSAPGAPRRQLTNAELASRAANPPVAVVAPRRPAALATYAELAGPAQRSANNAPGGTNAQRRRAILQLERLGRTYTNAELIQEIKKVQRFDATMKSRKKGGKSRKQRKTRRN